MLPRPLSGALRTLGKSSVGILDGVDEHYVAVIGFGLFVEKFEYSSRTRKTHGDHIDLHRSLTYHHCHLTGYTQEVYDNAYAYHVNSLQTHVHGFVQKQQSAEYRQQNVHYVTYIIKYGHQNVAVTVCFGRIVEKLVVEFDEFGFTLFLVIEYLNDLLTVDHFFDIAFRRGEGALLAHHIFGGAAAHHFDDIEHHANDQYNEKRHPQAVVYHHHEDRHHTDKTLESLRQALSYHLTERVGIVGIGGHYVAVSVSVEVFDGQGFHLMEHIHAEAFERALRDYSAQSGIQEGSYHADHVYRTHRD